MTPQDDEKFMAEAFKEAYKAFEANEVPIGAVLVYQNKIVARAHNQTELLKDVTAHAEILAITAATAESGIKFLDDYTLYVTLEPCPMCAGALRWARIGRLVYAANDTKAGYTVFSPAILHPKTVLSSGIMEKDSAEMLQRFFKMRR